MPRCPPDTLRPGDTFTIRILPTAPRPDGKQISCHLHGSKPGGDAFPQWTPVKPRPQGKPLTFDYRFKLKPGTATRALKSVAPGMEESFPGGLWSRNYHTDLIAAGIARLRLFESKGKDIAVRGSIPESEPAHIQLTTGGDWLLATDYQGRNQTLQEVETFRPTAMPLPIFLEGEGFKKLTILFTLAETSAHNRAEHTFARQTVDPARLGTQLPNSPIEAITGTQPNACTTSGEIHAFNKNTSASNTPSLGPTPSRASQSPPSSIPPPTPPGYGTKDPEAGSSRQTRYQPVGRSEGKPAGQLAKNSSALPNEGCFGSPKKGMICDAKDSSTLQNEGWAQGGLQHLQTSPPLARARHCQSFPRAQVRTHAQAAQLRRRFGTRCDEFGCGCVATAGATRNRSYRTQIIGL